MKTIFVATIAFVALGLSGCGGAPTRDDTPADAEMEWPERTAPKPGDTVYHVDRQASMLHIRVDPAGPMAGLGHSHVIGGHAIGGSIRAEKSGATQIDLSIDVDELEVDRRAWRRLHGLDPDLDADAIEDTRGNMLGPNVLDAENHPTIAIRSVAVSGPAWLPDVTARIRVRGHVRERTIPVSVVRHGDGADGRLEARGYIEILQTNFGIQPYSAAGGALRVADRLEIRFRIVAVVDGSDVAMMPGKIQQGKIDP